MSRDFYAGAWYADATPAGAFVAFTPGVGFQTSQGSVSLPPGEPWGLGYVRCTDVGGLRFAGQAHSSLDPACWEWTGSGWFPFAPPCIGVSPVLYDLSGELLRSDGSIGSQGYRYAWPNGTPGGQIVTGDQTYGPWNGLSQYSQAGDSLWIGQGMADGSGVLVWDGAVLRQLEAGATTFIRVQVSGEQVSVAFNNVAGCVIYQLTQAELRALPIYAPSQPSPHPTPTPSPEPIPMESKRLPDDVHAIVVALYARNLVLSHGSDDDRRALQKKICETVRARKGERWGWKSNHGVGIANAKDAIAELPAGATFTPNQRQPLYMWDLFNGGDRKPKQQPVMSETEHVEQFFVPVEPIDHLADVPEPEPAPEPRPDPKPAPPSVDLKVLLDRIDLSDRRSAAAQAETNALLVRIAESLEVLRARPLPIPIVQPWSLEGRVTIRGDVRLNPVKP